MASKPKPPNYWKSLENTLYEAKKVMKEHNLDKFPTQKKLNELKCSSLGNVINKYHGGSINFRKKHFGEKGVTKPNGYWHSLENTIDEAKKLMEEHNYDTLPSSDKVRELGFGPLRTAISRYHGGLRNFREILNQELGIKSNKEHLTEVWKKYISE